MKKKTFVVNNRKFRTHKIVGEGSHAVVWLAQALFYPHDEITIKIAKDNEAGHECLKNEIAFLKEAHHPNIPPLLEIDSENAHWFAMPYLQSIKASIPTKGKLTEYDISLVDLETGYPSIAKKIPLVYRQKLTLRILEDIGAVICYVSSGDIVHADISPSNIMESRGSLVTKRYFLTDWGAMLYAQKHQEDSFASIHFAAPERFTGTANAKSDLYSLGAVAFYILTGTIPYPGKNQEEYYLNTVIYDGVSPSDVEKDIVSALAKLISKLLRREAKLRPGAEELCKKVGKIKAKLF